MDESRLHHCTRQREEARKDSESRRQTSENAPHSSTSFDVAKGKTNSPGTLGSARKPGERQRDEARKDSESRRQTPENAPHSSTSFDVAEGKTNSLGTPGSARKPGELPGLVGRLRG